MKRLFTGFVVVALGYSLAPCLADSATKSGETLLHSFGSGTDGTDPYSNLIDISGTLYGTTPGGGIPNQNCRQESCGTVFSINAKTGAETVVYSFAGAGDGESPYAGLINVSGALYGTTLEGGSGSCSGYGCGTVFSINPNTGAETVLYRFTGGSDGG